MYKYRFLYANSAILPDLFPFSDGILGLSPNNNGETFYDHPLSFFHRIGLIKEPTFEFRFSNQTSKVPDTLALGVKEERENSVYSIGIDPEENEYFKLRAMPWSVNMKWNNLGDSKSTRLTFDQEHEEIIVPLHDLKLI